MKYLFIEIKIQEGEYTHDHRCIHTTNCKNLDFAAEYYTAHYWGYGERDFNDEWWWWNGIHCGRLYKWKELTKKEFNFLNKLFY